MSVKGGKLTTSLFTNWTYELYIGIPSLLSNNLVCKMKIV